MLWANINLLFWVSLVPFGRGRPASRTKPTRPSLTPASRTSSTAGGEQSAASSPTITSLSRGRANVAQRSFSLDPPPCGLVFPVPPTADYRVLRQAPRYRSPACPGNPSTKRCNVASRCAFSRALSTPTLAVTIVGRCAPARRQIRVQALPGKPQRWRYHPDALSAPCRWSPPLGKEFSRERRRSVKDPRPIFDRDFEFTSFVPLVP